MPGEKSRVNGAALSILCLLSMLALGVAWTGGERVLGQDSFAYVDMAKEFAYDFPNKFGDWWPYGFPLAAVPLYWAGIHPFVGLFIITVASFAFLLWLAPRSLPLESRGGSGAVAVVAALALSPACAQLIVFDLADPFFGASLAAFAACLTQWPHRWAVIAAPVLALAAFSIRYVGVFTFGLVGLYALIEWRTLRAQRMLPPLIASSTVVGIVTAVLLWSNVRASGRITGPQPIGESSIWTWPLHFADLGLAVPAAFTSTHYVQSFQHQHPTIMLIAGLIIMTSAMALVATSWLRPLSPYSRPLALVAGGYVITIVTMRATTPFPELSFPRYLFPALFPLAYLLTARPSIARSRLVAAGGALSIIVSIGLAIRGVAPDQKTDVSSARRFLTATLQPSDTLTVNLPARGLAAYFNNRFQEVGNADGHEFAWTVSPTNWQPTRTTFTIVAARGTPSARQFDAGELSAVMRAVDAGRVEIVHKDDSVIIVRAREARTP